MINISSMKTYDTSISWDPLALQLETLKDKRIFAIIDENVKWFFKKKLEKEIHCKTYFIKAIEENKSQKTVDKLLEFLLENNADRKVVLLSVGGGITSDLVGFVASIYKRGIIWISIPTTLLAQVDASVGGKTAINCKYGKNIIGSFYPPAKVIMTHEPAESWSDEIFLEGLAEILKIFLVFDIESFNKFILEGCDAFSELMTKRSVELKAEVVKTDPWEKNLRSTLNYGHTFGHAIEIVKGVRHGIAVSYGIRIANIIAALMGIMSEERVNKINEIFDNLNFPPIEDMPSFEEIFPFIKQDKKNIRGTIMMILPNCEKSLMIEAKNYLIPINTSILEKGYYLAIQD